AQESGNQKSGGHESKDEPLARQRRALNDPRRRHAERKRGQRRDGTKDRGVEQRAVGKRIGEQRAVGAQAEDGAGVGVGANADPYRDEKQADDRGGGNQGDRDKDRALGGPTESHIQISNFKL